MNKIYTLTVSSKGQVTIPIELRKIFKVNEAGDKLVLKLNDVGQASISKPSTLDDLHQYLAPKLKGKKPLKNARQFYQTRKPRSL